MFDNPNEELKKLEKQLLAVEKKDDDFESFYNDILREFGPESSKEPARKSATKNATQKKTPAKSAPAGTGKKKGKKKAKKSLKGLVITLCLECAGIVAIILWWIFRIL